MCPSDGLNVSGDGPSPQSSEPAASELLDFDVFSPSEPAAAGEGKSADSSSPPEGSERQPGDAQVPPQDAGSRQTPQPSGGESAPPAQQPDLAAALNAIAASLAELRQARTQPQPQPQQTRTEAPPPKFNLQVPPEVQNLVMSEDATERQNGFNVLVNGLANAIWQEVVGHTRVLEHRLSRAVPETVSSRLSQEQQQEQMRQEFFTEYPQLGSSAGMRQLVASTAQGLAQQLAAAGYQVGWTPEFRDQVAKAVYESFGYQAPTPVRNGPARPNLRPITRREPGQRQPAPQPFVAGRGNRVNGPGAGLTDEQKDIFNTLDIPIS